MHVFQIQPLPSMSFKHGFNSFCRAAYILPHTPDWNVNVVILSLGAPEVIKGWRKCQNDGISVTPRIFHTWICGLVSVNFTLPRGDRIIAQDSINQHWRIWVNIIRYTKHQQTVIRPPTKLCACFMRCTIYLYNKNNAKVNSWCTYRFPYLPAGF